MGPPLEYSVLLHRLVGILKSERWFPHEFEPLVPGEPISEFGVIERRCRGNYIYHARRHHPLDPRVLAEETHRRFFSARAAAKWYLKWEPLSPGLLDGWTVER